MILDIMLLNKLQISRIIKFIQIACIRIF
jgi:hypothetical protein